MRSSKSRSRNKSNRQRTLGNVVNRVFDSSGPEGKVRGTPQQIIEKYLALARDAQLSNDRVAEQSFFQHAEHYTRMLGEAQREMAERQSQQGGQPFQNRQGGEDEQGGNTGNGGHQQNNNDGYQRRDDQGRDGSGRDGQNRDNQQNRDGQQRREWQNRDRGDDRSNRNRDDRQSAPAPQAEPAEQQGLPEAVMTADADSVATQSGPVDTPENTPAPAEAPAPRRGRQPRERAAAAPVAEDGDAPAKPKPARRRAVKPADAPLPAPAADQD